MPAPLLIADVPWLLYRSFFALPKSIVGADGQPVNALLGTVNAILAVIDERPPAPRRGVVACMGAEQADYRVELYPPYHAHREPMPAELARAVGSRRPTLLASLGWTCATRGELEADDVMFSYARVEEERGGRALLLTGDRDLYAAVNEQVAVLELRKDAALGRSARSRCASATASTPRRCRTSSRCAATPPTGSRARPASAPRPPRSCCPARLAGGGAGGRGRRRGRRERRARRPGHAPADRRRAARERRAAAHVQADRHPPADRREAPADRATDLSAGAKAARELGMDRLAERLEGMGRAANAAAAKT